MNSNLLFKTSALILFIACICVFIQYNRYKVSNLNSEQNRATPPQGEGFLTENEVEQYLKQSLIDTTPVNDINNTSFQMDSATLILLTTSKSASFTTADIHSLEYDFLMTKLDLIKYLLSSKDTIKQK